jgi:hypothetical protein
MRVSSRGAKALSMSASLRSATPAPVLFSCVTPRSRNNCCLRRARNRALCALDELHGLHGVVAVGTEGAPAGGRGNNPAVRSNGMSAC